MSKHIGTVGQRLTLTVTLKNRYCYTTYYTYKGEDNYIYTMEDAEGNQFVWKTTNLLGMDNEVSVETKHGVRTEWVWDGVRNGDTAVIKATVKEHGEYKGTEQTVLTRVKVLSISHIPTKEEREQKKREDQMDSLKGGDFIWKMSYRRFKEHYADCETIAGSYDREKAEIEVIIREGRLVPSGTRGMKYKGFVFENPDKTESAGYYAISDETARRRLLKEHPDATDWELKQVYDYYRMGR